MQAKRKYDISDEERAARSERAKALWALNREKMLEATKDNPKKATEALKAHWARMRAIDSDQGKEQAVPNGR